ncbi:polycomb complex protein BMI-1-A-like [Limulus polyphemus]|uniref:Polycomb complex protein BMI-1-A-like n=1 Tax=Limulus polyphemus TaxID=6850 RepID=A0ABM1TMY5_LIMPO|nr:polycomb complex protein BMI-1-A-like [Limulus polyphemus]
MRQFQNQLFLNEILDLLSATSTFEAEVGPSSPPIRNMYQPSGLRVLEVNPYLTCVLCGGYFVDATTIIECLHSSQNKHIVRGKEHVSA